MMPTDPTQTQAEDPTPQPDRIARNIAAMRSQGASEQDIESYLTQHEGLAPTTGAQDTGLSARNVMRSLMQGATLNLGDSKKLPASVRINADAESAFKNAHPNIDFASKLVGGALAPLAAMVAAPEALGGLAGAALLGAGTGAVSGAAEGQNVAPMDRLENAGQGGAAGMAGGVAGYGVGKAAGGALSALLDRVNPSRAVARAANALVSPADVQRLAQINAQAPGTASAATATLPGAAKGQPVNSRFLSMVRGVGASPKAAADAEQSLMDQQSAIKKTTDALGAHMDALNGRVPASSVQNALAKAQGVLGAGKVPDAAPDYETQELRDVLSRLRYAARQAEKRGTEANGPTTYEIKSARNALQQALYAHVPQFRDLDAQYGTMMDQQRQVDKLLKTVRLSRQNYAGNTAFNATSGSLGGSLPSGRAGVAMSVIDKMLTNKAGAADAVAQGIVRPGTAAFERLMSNLPKSHPIAAHAPTVLSASAVPALRGLLFPADSAQ